MLDYEEAECVYCDEHAVIRHQYVGDARCESCGEWQEEDQDDIS